jgi:hypothetical protein
MLSSHSKIISKQFLCDLAYGDVPINEEDSRQRLQHDSSAHLATSHSSDNWPYSLLFESKDLDRYERQPEKVRTPLMSEFQLVEYGGRECASFPRHIDRTLRQNCNPRQR